MYWFWSQLYGSSHANLIFTASYRPDWNIKFVHPQFQQETWNNIPDRFACNIQISYLVLERSASQKKCEVNWPDDHRCDQLLIRAVVCWQLNSLVISANYLAISDNWKQQGSAVRLSSKLPSHSLYPPGLVQLIILLTWFFYCIRVFNRCFLPYSRWWCPILRNSHKIKSSPPIYCYFLDFLISNLLSAAFLAKPHVSSQLCTLIQW